MSRVSGSIPNFANGVSQQALALRLPSQGQRQVNAYSTIVDGLKKRPPTEHRAMLGASQGSLPAAFDDAVTHIINRDVDERYLVMMSQAGVKVFDLFGNEKPVNAPNGFGYLATSGIPDYRAVSVADFTFITNPEVTCALNPSDIVPLRSPEVIIPVLAGNYGKTYKIYINDIVVAEYTTPTGTSGSQSPAVSTSFIAERLFDGRTIALDTTPNGEANGNWTWKASDKSLLSSGITAGAGWTVKLHTSTIYISRPDGQNFTVRVDDGLSNRAMMAVKGTVQDFADLPSYCEDGFIAEVANSPGTQYDNYTVKFSAESPSTARGVWEETASPGMIKSILASTMPHVLVREADGSFTFREASWDERKAGDDETCPAPSFVGKTVNDIVFFKNRLGFLAGESVVLSRAGSYFDFWRATATALLDDDPIDVASTSNDVTVFRSGVPFSDRLVLFSDQRQIVLRGNELLTPKTASLLPTTSFSVSRGARPAAAGDVLFLPVDRGQHSMVREYFFDSRTGQATADDVTSHVPQYIEGSVRKMAASTHEDILALRTDARPETLYIYKYYWSDDRKLQSSWSEWNFPGAERVVDFSFIDSSLVVLLRRDGKYFIETLRVQPGGVDDGADFVVHLDRRIRQSGSMTTYDPIRDMSFIPKPLLFDPSMLIVTAGSETGNAGVELTPAYVGATDIAVRGDVRNYDVYFGTPYRMSYELSPVFVRQQAPGGGLVALTDGRLQVSKILFQYSKSAFFRVEVTPKGRKTRVYSASGRLMGSPDNVTDRVTIRDGSYSVPILSKNDRVKVEVVTESYLPSALLSAEWVGEFNPRSRRV